jgi:acetylornithine deacetylase/succinyl-diaminopimelate desuccinylase-like protein
MANSRDEIVALMKECIRNRCINPPGGEMKSIRTIDKYLQSYGMETEVFETAPERGNLLSMIGGTAERPSLMFGPSHVDVVPVENPEVWAVPPFEGIVKDECIWGRGAVDMLFIVACQTVAFAHLHQKQFRPRGDLKLLIVADEEAGGKFGAEYMANNYPEKVRTDYLITEMGGFELAPKRIAYIYAEKGAAPVKLRVRGEERHGSMPYLTDNAVVTMSDAVTRLQEYEGAIDVSIISLLLESMDVGRIQKWLLKQPRLLPRLLRTLGRNNETLARFIHSLSHMTISPNLCRGGTKFNVIPGEAEAVVDIRTLPGQDQEYVFAHIRRALGNLNEKIEVSILDPEEGGFISYGNASNPKSELVSVIADVVKGMLDIDYSLVPMVLPGASDSRHFRRTFNTEAYGFSLFDGALDAATIGEMPHSDNERVTLRTLDLTYDFYMKCARSFLG